MLWMSLIVYGISPDKFKAIFDTCVPMFITRSNYVFTRDCYLEYLLRESNYINKTIHARIDLYAQK